MLRGNGSLGGGGRGAQTVINEREGGWGGDLLFRCHCVLEDDSGRLQHEHFGLLVSM